jgi:hypothetical protein
MVYFVGTVAIMVSWDRYELVVVVKVGVVEIKWWLWFVVVMFECGVWVLVVLGDAIR